MSYLQHRARFESGEYTVQQCVQDFLQQISDQQELNAFITVAHNLELLAKEADERFAAGLARPLEGCVVAVKDNISVAGMRMTCASKMLENFQPVYSATVIEKLLNAGAIIIGKTNMDEFAMGSSNETSFFGPVLNPANPTKVPGGSSGGSAVAVAAGMCHISLGSDTGGSIRQPAAFCGVYGHKPTYGSVSRYGLTAFASSLDQIGGFTSTIQDMRLLMEVIEGQDPLDSTSVQQVLKPKPRTEIQGLRIGVLGGDAITGCSPAIAKAYNECIDQYRAKGAVISTVSIPNSEVWIPTYFILATAEASSNLARFDGVRYGHRSVAVAEDADDSGFMTSSRSTGFGTEVKRRILLGTYVLSSGYYDAYYGKAQQAKASIQAGYNQIFNDVDVVLLPTTPTTAFTIGEKSSDPVQMWLSDFFTVSANIAGIPAINFPFGADENGLPIGLQLQGPMFSDELLMNVCQQQS